MPDECEALLPDGSDLVAEKMRFGLGRNSTSTTLTWRGQLNLAPQGQQTNKKREYFNEKLEVAKFKKILGFVACESTVPSFTWVQDEFSPDGVPLLSINFHDEQPNDVAILKSYNPIPKQALELEENVDKCIFNGHLRDESNVYVTLTGGCPFENNFDVSIRLFKVKRQVHTSMYSHYHVHV